MNYFYKLIYNYYSATRYSVLINQLGFKENRTDLGGHKISSFVRSGSKGPLVLIHGLLDAPFGFRKLAPLIDREWTVILTDIPGFGRSRMPLIKYLYQLDIFAELIYKSLLKSGHRGITLGGHSMGGLISQHIALIDKKRKNPIIKNLILISPGGVPHKRRDEMRGILFPKTEPEVARLLNYLYFQEFPEPNFIIKRTLVSEWNNRVHEFLSENTIERESEIFFGKKASEIKIPALIISGVHDEITPPDMMKKIHSYIGKSELKLMPDARHAIHLEKAKDVAMEMNRFLNR